MSLIINEFEIVTEQPAKMAEDKAESKDTETAQQLSPQDIHNVMVHRAGRMARIRAH